MKKLAITILLIALASTISMYGQTAPKLTRYEMINRCWAAFKTNSPAVIGYERRISLIDTQILKLTNEKDMLIARDQALKGSKSGRYAYINSYDNKYQNYYTRINQLQNDRTKLFNEIELIKQQYILQISPKLPLK